MEEKEYLKSFTKEEYLSHVKKMQDCMKECDIDMLLLSSPENIFYTTGYRSWYTSSLFRPVFVFLPKKGEPAIYLRILEKTTVENTSYCRNIYCSGSAERKLKDLNAKDSEDALRQFISSLDYKVNKIGIEAGDGQHYFWSLNILKDLIDSFRGKVEFVDGTVPVQRARMIKTKWEAEKIRTAGYVTERAIVDTFSSIRAGITTEKEIARGIASRMTANGVDKISYLTVNSGKDKYHTFNSYATDRIVEQGDIVLVDISGHIDGYASDLTRVMYLGKKPPSEYAEMAHIARECVHAGFKMLKPGIKISEMSDAVENYLRNAKYGRDVIHTSGHSIGLNVTEFPNITGSENEIIKPGMIFSIENGVYPYDVEKGASSISISFRMEDEAMATENEPEWLSGPGKALYTYEDFF